MKYALKKIRRVRVNDIETHKSLATVTDLQSARFTGNSDVVYSEGNEGARLAAFDRNKVSGFEATNGVIELDLLALQVGGEVETVTNGTGVSIRESHTITAAEASAKSFTIGHIARGTAGAEVRFIYKADKMGNPKTAYEQQAVIDQNDHPLTTGHFGYSNVTTGSGGDAVTKGTITFFTGDFVEGDVVVYDYYPQFTTYEVVENDSNKFAIAGEVIFDAWFTDLCTEKDVPLQLVMPKGKLSGEFTYEMGDNAATQGLSVDALSNPCEGGSMWKLYTYDMEDITDAIS